MKLREHLNELNITELNKIAKKLHCVDSGDYFGNKNLYVNRICGALDMYLWETIENRDPDIYIDDKTLGDLKKLSFRISNINDNSYDCLSELGIVYKVCVIPDDLQERLLERWRSEIVTILNNYSAEVVPSAFLRLILLIGYIEKEKITTYEELLNNNISNKEILSVIADYLKSTKIIKIETNGSLSLNQYLLNIWRKGFPNTLKEFYDFCCTRKGINLEVLFTTFKLIQKSSREWVNISKGSFILEDYRREINVLRALGGVRYAKIDCNEYIQISPEFWFMLTGQPPEEWLVKNTIITPDFELFIPYFFNPLIIDLVNRSCELLNQIIPVTKKKTKVKVKQTKNSIRKKEIEFVELGYINDYYLIYNIKNVKEHMSKKDYEEIFILNFENIMPDTVKDELDIRLQNL